MRGALEALAARLAAERITDAELEQLRRLAFGHTGHGSEQSVVADADHFHKAVHKFAHSPQLLEPLQLIYGRVLHYRNVTLRLPGRSASPHRATSRSIRPSRGETEPAPNWSCATTSKMPASHSCAIWSG